MKKAKSKEEFDDVTEGLAKTTIDGKKEGKSKVDRSFKPLSFSF